MERGQIVQLGPHRLMCGDAFNPLDVDLLVENTKIDILYCDPPYGKQHTTDYMRRSGEGPNISNGSIGNRTRRSHAVIEGDFTEFDPRPVLDEFKNVQEQFWWGADYYAQNIPERNGGAWLVWDKRVTPALDKMHGARFELCWSRQRHAREIIRYTWCGVAGMRKIDGKRVHSTQKPVGLAEWFLSAIRALEIPP